MAESPDGLFVGLSTNPLVDGLTTANNVTSLHRLEHLAHREPDRTTSRATPILAELGARDDPYLTAISRPGPSRRWRRRRWW
jgi:hypothetical protein